VKNSEALLTEKLRTMDFTIQQTLFRELKKAGYAIGIITNDNDSSTSLFLSLMGWRDGGLCSSRDSFITASPIHRPSGFCKHAGSRVTKVAMVGIPSPIGIRQALKAAIPLLARGSTIEALKGSAMLSIRIFLRFCMTNGFSPPNSIFSL
jgi:hypothetical protein